MTTLTTVGKRSLALIFYFAAFTAVPIISAVCLNIFSVNPDFFSPSNTLSVGGVKTFVTEPMTKSVYLLWSTCPSFSKMECTRSR